MVLITFNFSYRIKDRRLPGLVIHFPIYGQRLPTISQPILLVTCRGQKGPDTVKRQGLGWEIRNILSSRQGLSVKIQGVFPISKFFVEMGDIIFGNWLFAINS